MQPILGFQDASLLRAVMNDRLKHYTYSTAVTDVAATSSVQATSQVESGSDFTCNVITGRVFVGIAGGLELNRTLDFAAVAQPRVEIIDSASGASLFDRSDVNFMNYWGYSFYPLKLAQPIVFEARTVITAIVTNLASVVIRFQLAFHGYKVKRRAA